MSTKHTKKEVQQFPKHGVIKYDW